MKLTNPIQYILELEELTEWGRFQLLCDLQYLESVSDSLGELSIKYN